MSTACKTAEELLENAGGRTERHTASCLIFIDLAELAVTFLLLIDRERLWRSTMICSDVGWEAIAAPGASIDESFGGYFGGSSHW